MTTARAIAFGVGYALVLAACTSASDDAATCARAHVTPESAPVDATSFVAFAQHFAGYHAWPSRPGVTRRASVAAHGDGPMTVYVNRPARPAPGSTGSFPVGTVIVKEGRSQTVAMVKRGGDFNAQGAAGWEWFELDEGCATDAPTIRWRGIGPPAGEKYGGDPNGCNGCHSVAADTDFVMTDGLSP